jgi:hypothetical protein
MNKKPGLPKSLKKILAKAVKAYGEDGILDSYINDVGGFHGDTLAEFIVREASDVFSEGVSTKKNVEEIVAALDSAVKQMQAVCKALATPEPPGNRRTSLKTALEDAFRKAAEERHAVEGVLEFDGGALVSMREGGSVQGAYVQGWKRIPATDLTAAQRKRFRKLLAK